MSTDYPQVSDNETTQAFYEFMRDSGESHRMAEMLAFQQGPALETDAAFLQGECNGNQFAKLAPHVGEFYKKRAEAAGQSIKGKVYKSSLAAFPGDPEAWVSSRAEVKDLIAKRNWSCEGMVRHKRIESNDEGKQYNVNGVAEDILDAEVERDLIKNPDIAPTPKEKLEYKEKLREKRRPIED